MSLEFLHDVILLNSLLLYAQYKVFIALTSIERNFWFLSVYSLLALGISIPYSTLISPWGPFSMDKHKL
jgi:hypothetical protein